MLHVGPMLGNCVAAAAAAAAAEEAEEEDEDLDFFSLGAPCSPIICCSRSLGVLNLPIQTVQISRPLSSLLVSSRMRGSGSEVVSLIPWQFCL